MDPTGEPTASPLCLGAKYQGSMSCSHSECDELWGGESMVSENCNFLLVMEMNGNLAVYAESENTEGRRLLSSGRPFGWYFGWSSETVIANTTGESVPVFMVTEDGSLMILEYTDGAHGSDHEELWSLHTSVNSSVFTFDLTADGCLEINVDSVSDAAWTMCSEFYLPTPQPSMEPTHHPIYLVHVTEHTTDIPTMAQPAEDDAANVMDALTSGNFDAKYMVFYIIILILICVICALCVGGCVYLKKRKGNKEEKDMFEAQTDAQSPSAWSPDSPSSAEHFGYAQPAKLAQASSLPMITGNNGDGQVTGGGHGHVMVGSLSSVQTGVSMTNVSMEMVTTPGSPTTDGISNEEAAEIVLASTPVEGVVHSDDSGGISPDSEEDPLNDLYEVVNNANATPAGPAIPEPPKGQAPDAEEEAVE